MSKTVGEQITEIRTRLGLNMREFAGKISPSVESSNVSRWERGINVPTIDRIKKIAELGNVSFKELMPDETKHVVKTIENCSDFELLLEVNRRGYRVCQ